MYHKLSSPPDSSSDSFGLDAILLSERHQRVVARCIEDIVVYDYLVKKKTPMKSFMNDQFRSLWQQQNETQREKDGQVAGLLARVERLEKASWNRDDAVEDMGWDCAKKRVRWFHHDKKEYSYEAAR